MGLDAYPSSPACLHAKYSCLEEPLRSDSGLAHRSEPRICGTGHHFPGKSPRPLRAYSANRKLFPRRLRDRRRRRFGRGLPGRAAPSVPKRRARLEEIAVSWHSCGQDILARNWRGAIEAARSPRAIGRVVPTAPSLADGRDAASGVQEAPRALSRDRPVSNKHAPG